MPPRNLALAAAVLLATSVPALAQTPDQDVRCVLAGNLFSTVEKDPARKQLAIAATLFFSGRADARLSPAQLRAAVLTQGKALGTTDAAAVMTACARTFQAKERATQAIGQEVARSQQPRAPVPVPPKK